MAANFSWIYPQNRVPVTFGRWRQRTVRSATDSLYAGGYAGRRRLVAQPGGLHVG